MSRISFPNPFDAEGFWIKGNLHTHTINSDGLLTPFQTALVYQSNGYGFLSITDHNRLTNIEDLRSDFEDLILLPGEEISVGGYHLVAFNIKSEIMPADDPESVIREVHRQNGEVIVAHPYWSALMPEDLLGLDGYLGIEVYNATCDVTVAKGYSSVYWDILLHNGRFTYGFAVDDAHGGLMLGRPTDACKGWIMVKARRFDEASIMESIRRGLFYSSTGPEIHDIQVDDEKIHVKTSPAKSISFIAKNGRGRRSYALNEPLREAVYTVRGNEDYIRLEIEDERGGVAWTNPMILETR